MTEVRHIPCGPYVNESERIAVEKIKTKLQTNESGPWIILSNLSHASMKTHVRSDEIDLIVVGPSGVLVIEIKHWDFSYLKQHPSRVEQEAERVNTKAKRVAGKIRAAFDIGFVEAKLLLTRGALRFQGLSRPNFRGIAVYGLQELAELLVVGGTQILTAEQIRGVAKKVEPLVKVALDGDLRRFGSLINLEKLSPKDETFHRVYRGQHLTHRDRIILHLYDLSASDVKNPEAVARREFDVIQRWQKSPLVPSLFDSFQEVEGYPGELWYFSLVDTSAPSLISRQKDKEWAVEDRIVFCREAAGALAFFHRPDDPELPPIVHRRISPQSLRVRYNGKPLFTDFSLARISDSNCETVSAVQVELGTLAPYMAPEIHNCGWTTADNRSDVFALCASLLLLFTDDNALAHEAETVLRMGLSVNPEDRPTADELESNLNSLIAEPIKAVKKEMIIPDSDYWDEDTIIPFQNSRYKIVARLGKGGIGQTFKVVEVDALSEELYGTYVAKVIRHEEDGERALIAYRKVRAHTTHPHLSVIHEIAPSWEANRFVSLLKWVEGMPLQDLIGVIPLHAEDIGEESTEGMLLRWLFNLCEALGTIHSHGLIHGDVSPRNIIVQEGEVFLTDYDTVTAIGNPGVGGNPLYSRPSREHDNKAAPADDLFALAASFFQVLFDQEPFLFNGIRSKERGINWDGVDWEEYPKLRLFLDMVTPTKSGQQLVQTSDALVVLNNLRQDFKGIRLPSVPQLPKTPGVPVGYLELSEQVVPWLTQLLSSYPGSRHGNNETRGLDSSFAAATYVETRLDGALQREIRNNQVDLVILFGNAGDGKTAFLQNLLKNLGLDKPPSSQRVSEHIMSDGRKLLVNLDGSAAWNGKGANELLTEVFAPFQQGTGEGNRLHIVAVNSGKLLEWIEDQQKETPLTEQLRSVLQGDGDALNTRFRLIDLNRRSLVGGIDEANSRISSEFIETILNRLLGNLEAKDPWEPCSRCLSQNRCSARQSVLALRDPKRSPIIRSSLTDALQACHHRGEIHITARELRAALSYIFFGLYDCLEVHSDTDYAMQHFADRAFDAFSPHRQGELLAELVRFDPALEFHPVVDRALLRAASSSIPLSTLRRSAYFDNPVLPEVQSGSGQTLTLTQGKYLPRFRQVPLMNGTELNFLLRDLCLGIAKLENLPELAYTINEGVPLRITPRTPTESAFWVVKPWERFFLEPVLPVTVEGLEVLHSHLHLVYRYPTGYEERLVIGLELFHLLLDLAAGVQLSGTAQEGVFANLEIFTQRLAREDSRELRGWHPAVPGRVDWLRVVNRDGHQKLVREAVT